MKKRNSFSIHITQSTLRNQRGFTVIELLSASLIMLFFFGWLTYAYLTVTRAVFQWQNTWSVASVTNSALGWIIRDLQEAVVLEDLSPSGITLIRFDGQRVTYLKRGDGVFRNEQKFSNPEVTLIDLQINNLGPLADSTNWQVSPSMLNDLMDKNPVPPEWLHVTMIGRTYNRSYTAKTTVRLYSLRPTLVQDD